jgi:hypothetical protein
LGNYVDRTALSRKAGNYAGLLTIAATQTGLTRLQSIVNAYDEITALRDAAKLEPSLVRSPEVGPYLDELTGKVRRLALAESGFLWDGKIVVRDSPYGPKVKFVSSVDVAGPATKGRSGEAAEDEEQRPLTGTVAERGGRPIVEPGDGEIGQRIADSEPVGPPVPRDGRHDDLALVAVELLGVRAVARIEENEARIVGGRHG